ncbi:MAG TPA: c-type cytochrome [Anaerolineales bacterium]|nr:c-type cytochrome [Anaerolineales bacterium]
MTVRVVFGTILVALTMIITAFVLVTEPARMTDFESGYQGRSIEAGAALYATSCRGCHGAQGEGVEGVGPALNARDLFDGTRFKEIGWAGTTRDFVYATISGGRPRASAAFSAYPQRMPTWSQEFGGPLRLDQVRNIADFVMNWEQEALTNQPAPTATPNPNAAGTDLTVELPEGDAANGELLFNGKGPGNQYPCSACHSLQEGVKVIGPSLFGIATTAATRKEGYDAAKYLHESIVLPGDFIVEGFTSPSAMPATFADQMTKQDLADVLAYLLALK